MSHKVLHCFASLFLALAVSLTGFTPVFAAPPANDNFADAIIITSLPFTDTTDTSEASIEAGEPTSECEWYGTPTSSVWYAFTPLSKGMIVASVPWAAFTPMVTAYTGSSLTGLTEVRCQTFNNQMSFEASAGVTYYFRVANLYPWETGGSMQFQLDEILPPANDDFANARIVDTLPFDDTVMFNQATSREDGEQLCVDYGTPARTVWYSFTPATSGVASVDIPWSEFTPMLGVYTGVSLNSLTQIGCQFYTGNTLIFDVDAGTSYYIQVAKLYPYEWDGQVQFHLDVILPPPNDNFASATLIPSIPFDDSVQFNAATSIETGEPTPSCTGYESPWETIWYAFTPATSGSVTASIPWAAFSPVLAVYSGDSLINLTELGCRVYSNNLLTFHVDAGTTYYFQISKLYPWDSNGWVSFHLNVAPAPVADFWYNPSDPSVFDTVQFYNQSYDPGNADIEFFAWNFGDGATSTDYSPAHRYSADGDYTVQLAVTTYDGRTASTSQVVHVKTHDVALTKITAPQSAKSGQAQKIVIEVKNRRYAEYVRVDLYKSVPGGFQSVGSYIQYVPVRSGNQTSTFTFNYTFTKDDATQGKVTFKAVATIINVGDDWPADNELISSPPTKVTR